jgi:hypothetical protein
LACCNTIRFPAAGGQDDIGCERDHIRHAFANALGVARAPTIVDPQVAPDGPAQLLEALHECREAQLSLGIVGRKILQHRDAPHPLALLRARRERPRHCRAAEERDEVAASDPSCHLIPRPKGDAAQR